jgi:hypothetical protein
MSDAVEDTLREIYARDAAEYDETDSVGRLLAADYSARGLRRIPRGVAAIAAGGVGATACVAGALLLTSAGPAYAGWTADPSAASTASITASAAACNRTGHMSPTVWATKRVFSGQPVLTESRGIFTAAIYVTNGNIYACLTGATDDDFSSDYQITGQWYGSVGSIPEPNNLGHPYVLQQSVFQGDHSGQLPPAQLSLAKRRELRVRQLGGGYGKSMLGRVGSDVAAVTLIFGDGSTVSATVENGWYFAWWPWLEEPTTVRFMAASGAQTSPIVPAASAAKSGNSNAHNPGAGAGEGASSSAIVHTNSATLAYGVRRCDREANGFAKHESYRWRASHQRNLFASGRVLSASSSKFVGLISVGNNKMSVCVTMRHPSPNGFGVSGTQRSPKRPRANRIDDLGLSSSGSLTGHETFDWGRAGRDVMRVEFHFHNGSTLAARVQNGWYIAWWPGSLVRPASVRITQASGAVTSTRDASR